MHDHARGDNHVEHAVRFKKGYPDARTWSGYKISVRGVKADDVILYRVIQSRPLLERSGKMYAHSKHGLQRSRLPRQADDDCVEHAVRFQKDYPDVCTCPGYQISVLGEKTDGPL